MYHSNVSGRFSSGLRSLPSSAPFLSYPSLQSHVFIIFWPNSRDEYSSKLCFHHGDPLQNATSIRFFRSRVTIFISMSDALVHLLSPTERDPRRSEALFSLNSVAALS
ncbi:hypothetical protein T12_4142 [Trichinella patagoniensis]|uniref:Uncharacterized protein n=1 Tax=Trichinella patagoniensis TaxID=990121 RepID=A0A0V0Z2V1_9BILA|nr:hypothetical protein T12_4142 [Trichinella patagoniensis]